MNKSINKNNLCTYYALKEEQFFKAFAKDYLSYLGNSKPTSRQLTKIQPLRRSVPLARHGMSAVAWVQRRGTRVTVCRPSPRLQKNKEKMMSHSQLLIVEDDFVCQHVYLSLLNDYQPVLAGTAAEALDCLSKHPFHCILLDLGLPDKTGEELLPLIRSNPLNGNTPILVISAHVDEQLGQQCLALGANHIYVKPVLPTMLRRMVESVLVH